MLKQTIKKPGEEYAILGIQVTGYIARVDASINYEVRDPHHFYEDAEIYKFGTSLEIDGVCTYPDERAGEEYQFTIYGTEPGSGRFDLKLDDCHTRDEDGTRAYHVNRDKETPVYDVPKGIGPLERRRKTQPWLGWCWVSPPVVTDMLTLLPNVNPLFVQIHEIKIGRKRWIVGLTLQTSDPSEE